MIRIRLILTLLSMAGCADHPDPTTRAIAAAEHTGGICTTETAPSLQADGGILEIFNCEDRAIRQISSLVYANQE